MSGASFRYLVKEGFRNTWTNRMMSIASICVLLSCLVLIGSASMIFLNINSLVQKIEDENVIMVYIDDEATDADIDEMGIKLNDISNVEKIEFVAKEDAWAEQIATMDEAQAEFFTETTDEIPLPDAYKVTVKDLEQFTSTVNEIKALSQRLEVAKMLQEKKTYQEIQHTTHASTATISRVNRCLSYGSDGYKLILERVGTKRTE